jgi:hypothetical protein
MRSRCCNVVVALVLAAAAGPARAEHEDLMGHARHPAHTVVLDNLDIRPADTTMDPGDVLVFENQSLQPIKVSFVEPADLKDRIRCELVRPTPDAKVRAPWQLFAWEDGKLTATIPPGRFASVCSLKEGNYTFLADPVNARARQPSGGGLPQKGQIVVK